MSVQSHSFRPTFPVVSVPPVVGAAAALFGRFLKWLTSPVQARPHSMAADVAAVRELAYRVQDSDPGFAADLYAAAARYEGER